PNLHVSGALRIEVNVLSVSRVFWAIVQSLGRCQPCLFPARCRDSVDVEVAVPFTDERECLPIRRPSMQVRWRFLGDAPRRSALNRNNVNERLMILLRIVADPQLRAIRRNQMVVVAARRESSVENLGRAPRRRNFLDAAVSV